MSCSWLDYLVAVQPHTCIHVLMEALFYVFYHACNVYGVDRALKILFCGRLLLPRDEFKTRSAAIDFLDVDAPTTGRRNSPNLMHLLKLSVINTHPGHMEGEKGNCDLEHFSKSMCRMTCESLSPLHLLIFNPFHVLLVTSTHSIHSHVSYSYLCCNGAAVVWPPWRELAAFPHVNFQQAGKERARSHQSNTSCRASPAPATIVQPLLLSNCQLFCYMAVSAIASHCQQLKNIPR